MKLDCSGWYKVIFLRHNMIIYHRCDTAIFQPQLGSPITYDCTFGDNDTYALTIMTLWHGGMRQPLPYNKCTRHWPFSLQKLRLSPWFTGWCVGVINYSWVSPLSEDLAWGSAGKPCCRNEVAFRGGQTALGSSFPIFGFYWCYIWWRGLVTKEHCLVFIFLFWLPIFFMFHIKCMPPVCYSLCYF